MSREATKVDSHIGARIRMRRIERKLSQSELADELGVSFQQVQKYEKGVNRVGAARLQQIGVFLKVPTNFFFAGQPDAKGEGGDTSAMTAFMTSHYGADIAEAFVRLPEDGKLRRTVRDLVVSIAAGRPAHHRSQRRA